ncbi:hypothetical protein VTO42DRAFT_8583 [Malbranchea cinnamomea]
MSTDRGLVDNDASGEVSSDDDVRLPEQGLTSPEIGNSPPSSPNHQRARSQSINRIDGGNEFEFLELSNIEITLNPGEDSDGSYIEDPDDEGKSFYRLELDPPNYRAGPPWHFPELYDEIERARRAGIPVDHNARVIIKYEPPEGRGRSLPPPGTVDQKPLIYNPCALKKNVRNTLEELGSPAAEEEGEENIESHTELVEVEDETETSLDPEVWEQTWKESDSSLPQNLPARSPLMQQGGDGQRTVEQAKVGKKRVSRSQSKTHKQIASESANEDMPDKRPMNTESAKAADPPSAPAVEENECENRQPHEGDVVLLDKAGGAQDDVVVVGEVPRRRTRSQTKAMATAAATEATLVPQTDLPCGPARRSSRAGSVVSISSVVSSKEKKKTSKTRSRRAPPPLAPVPEEVDGIDDAEIERARETLFLLCKRVFESIERGEEEEEEAHDPTPVSTKGKRKRKASEKQAAKAPARKRAATKKKQATTSQQQQDNNTAEVKQTAATTVPETTQKNVKKAQDKGRKASGKPREGKTPAKRGRKK